jgi:hypothetical protein
MYLCVEDIGLPLSMYLYVEDIGFNSFYDFVERGQTDILNTQIHKKR